MTITSNAWKLTRKEKMIFQLRSAKMITAKFLHKKLINPTWFSQSLTYLVLRIKIEPVTVAADATVRVYVWLLLSENQVIFGTVWIRRAKTVLSGQCVYLLFISRHGESVTEYVSEPRRIRNWICSETRRLHLLKMFPSPGVSILWICLHCLPNVLIAHIKTL